MSAQKIPYLGREVAYGDLHAEDLNPRGVGFGPQDRDPVLRIFVGLDEAAI